MAMKRRDFLRTAGLSGLALTTGMAAPVFAAAPPKRPRILLRGGYILSMDPKIGDLRGDVLIDNGKIAEVRPGINASGADVIDARDLIVLPGFVDTHRHAWQGSLRHLGVDWDLREYIGNMFGKFGIHFRPEDVYAGNLIGRLSALESGITTMLDWSHIMNTPEHADAAVQAHREMGLRTVFAMGWPQTPDPTKWIGRSTIDFPDDIRRVRKQYFSSNTGLVTLQMAARGPSFAVIEQVAKELALARELDLKTTMHNGGGGTVVAMNKAMKLGPDITYVHMARVTDEEMELVKSSGGTISISPPGEHWHSGWQSEPPPTIRFLRAGILPSLSVDTEVFAPGDMFSTIRGTLGMGRYTAAHPHANENIPAPANPQQWNSSSVISGRKVLEMATIAGGPPLGLESQIGSLTPGKQADILCMRMTHLNHHPVTDAVGSVVMAGDTASVDAVFVAGKAVKFNGRIVNTALVARARKVAAASRDYLLEKSGFPVAPGLRKS